LCPRAQQGAAAAAEEAGQVGELDPAAQRGFWLGSAPLTARPAQPLSPTGTAGAGGCGARERGGGAADRAREGARPSSGGAHARGGSPAAIRAPTRPGELAGSFAGAAVAGPGPVAAGDGCAGVRPGAAVDLNSLFVDWKAGGGAGLAADARERQQQLAELKRGVKVGGGMPRFELA
jgi:hypothetical protein